MLKAYFDDSNMGAGRVAVLAGWMAPANTWPRFAQDWERVLRMSPRIAYFKWKEWRGSSGEFAGISEPKKSEKLKLLIDVLADHKPVQVSCVSSNALHQQAFGENLDRTMRSPYYFSFYSVVTDVIRYAAKKFPGEPVDFIFDIQPGQMEAAEASWERMREIVPSDTKSAIGNVSFQNDLDVLPLQAADLSAGFTREQAEEACFGHEPPEPPWGDRGDDLVSITRTWTDNLYQEFFKITEALRHN